MRPAPGLCQSPVTRAARRSSVTRHPSAVTRYPSTLPAVGRVEREAWVRSTGRSALGTATQAGSPPCGLRGPGAPGSAS